jgi:LmbE family N-acetylglucosaminyl deacetylase
VAAKWRECLFFCGTSALPARDWFGSEFLDFAHSEIAMTAPIRVLALHSHPDDIEFQCAGTLALLRRAGCHVTLATMTPGDCGSAEHDAEAIAEIRRAEAEAAAALIEADYLCLEFRDLAIFNDDESRRRVTEVLRRTRPDLVLTAPPVDYLCDHEMTSLLVRDACFTAPIPNYATRQWDPAPPLAKIPHLYYVDAIEGGDRDGRLQPAGFHVDVSDVFEIKRQMLACHASQRNWLLRQHGIDEYLDSQAKWGAQRGSEVGVPQAEAFRQYLGHAYPHDNLLLALVGQDGRGRGVKA